MFAWLKRYGKLAGAGALLILGVLLDDFPRTLLWVAGILLGLWWFLTQYCIGFLAKIHAFRQRRRFVSFFVFVMVGAFIGAAVWFVVPKIKLQQTDSSSQAAGREATVNPAELAQEVAKLIPRQHDVEKGVTPEEVGPANGKAKAHKSIAVGNITQGPGSIAQVGENNQATIYNEPPPAKIVSWDQKPAQWQESSGLVDETQVTFSADRAIEIPTFAVKCDRPCNIREAVVFGEYNKVDFLASSDPTVSGFVFLSPRPLGAGVQVELRIRAQDGSLPKVLAVSIVSPDQVK